MRSTGEYDKLGKELFEEDFVTFSYIHPEPKIGEKPQMVICRIVFHNAGFRLKWADGYINNFTINSKKYTKVFAE